jgi:hypothetical protein
MKEERKKTVLAKIQTASTEVSDAASDLDKLLSELDAAPRAEKTTVSKVVAAAFSRLKGARVALSEVEKILKDELD